MLSTPLQSAATINPATLIPDANGRIRRFKVGDHVNVLRGGFRLYGVEILEAASDPLHPPGWSHCAGNSAKYRITSYDGWVYDWMLEAVKPSDKTTAEDRYAFSLGTSSTRASVFVDAKGRPIN